MAEYDAAFVPVGLPGTLERTMTNPTARAAALVVAICASSTAAGAAPLGPSPRPNVEPARAPQRLTLADAIARGLQHNLQAVLAAQGVEAASGARQVALAALLPALDAGARSSRQKINLEEFGLAPAPGESPLVGPYDVVRGDLTLTQRVLDLGAINRARAGNERLAAARFSLQDARDLVVVACAGAYLQAVAAESRVAAARAQLATAQALAARARNLRDAGTVAGIEVLRADVQLAAQRQRLIQAENELDRARLVLARAVGLPLGDPYVLVDSVPFADLDPGNLEDALTRARTARPDLQAARAQLRAAEDVHAAELGDALPSLVLSGDIGKVGPTTGTMKGVYTMMAAVRIPLFEGGQAQGRLRASRAEVEQQRARLTDLEARVELEVRMAFLDLAAAAEQVTVAEGARELAARQLAQAEDRFSAGVASNIEVVQAQQAVAEATESHIGSLYAHNLAKLALARALGVAETAAGQYLRGAQ